MNVLFKFLYNKQWNICLYYLSSSKRELNPNNLCHLNALGFSSIVTVFSLVIFGVVSILRVAHRLFSARPISISTHLKLLACVRQPRVNISTSWKFRAPLKRTHGVLENCETVVHKRECITFICSQQVHAFLLSP